VVDARARISDLRRRCQAHPAPERMREVNGLDPVLNCMTKLNLRTPQPWGERVAYVTDPDGNPVALAQSP
jgi:hypothetical protein